MDHIQNSKMQDKHIDDLLEFFSKWGLLIGYVFIGLIGKFGFDIVNKKRLTFWYVFGTSCIAYCIGFLSWEYCKGHSFLNPGLVVPCASLVSRDIMLVITVIDWKGIVMKFMTRSNNSNTDL